MFAVLIAPLLTGAQAPAAALPSPPPPPSVHPPVPLRGWSGCYPRQSADSDSSPFARCFHPWDYPQAAYEARESGVVGLRFTIGATRQDMRCEITRSSGSATLDRETCAMLVQRIIPGSSPRILPGEVQWVLPVSPPVDTRPPLITYFSADDYPAAALRANEQGRVGFVLDVTADGRVADCRLSQSSGSNALDNATCRILRSRARFLPARDQAGNPVPSRASGSLGWRLPED